MRKNSDLLYTYFDNQGTKIGILQLFTQSTNYTDCDKILTKEEDIIY